MDVADSVNMTDSKGIFSDCVFAFVPSSSLPPKDISAYTTIVESNGGTVVEPRRDGSIRIEEVTHIIANSIDFEQFTESQAYMIPVVTLYWIASSIKRGKQAQVRPFSPDPRMIFSKVTLTCADLPTIDKETIAGATIALGGMESADVTRQTTHICALSLDHPKCRTAIEKKLKVKIVLPHWFVGNPHHPVTTQEVCIGYLILTCLTFRFEDCFKLGKRIDEGPYCLPDPEILRVDPTAEVEIPTDTEGRLTGATSPNPDALVQGPAQPATVFRDKMVMISSDLNITPKSLNIVKMRITGGGGTIVDNVDDCDMFICQYRDGPDYIKAAQLEKEVGNLAWLLHLISHNEWTSPLRRLLHYPVPRDGIPGFKDLRICISNYGGDARIYLENLIKATGATYTKTMKTDNTHLITARSSSEKYEAAKDWGIETTNHLWIEESYARCEMQPLTVSKYTHFPPRTNLGEIIGQTFFDEDKLREYYYPGGDEPTSPRAKRKRQILAAAHENAQKGGPADGVVIGRREHKESEGFGDDAGEHVGVTKKNGGMAAPPPKNGAFATPARRERARAGKENETPSEVSTGSRSAKAKAMATLQHLATDIALYEKEKKRTSKDGPWGGKRAADVLDKSRGGRASSPTPGPDKQDDDDEARPSKKRRSSHVDETIRVMLTGFTRWVGQKQREDAERVRYMFLTKEEVISAC